MTKHAGIKMTYEFPYYEDQVLPKGFLTLDKRTHALFHYYLLCQKLLEKAGTNAERDQIIYDDARWMDKPYANIARGTAVRYGLVDPGEFLKDEIKQQVRLEIARLGFPEPAEEYWSVEPGKVVYT